MKALARARTRGRSAEDGYVAVFVALCLPLLVGMCALAIDVANWQSEGAHLQKVVDDAALGGVVYLPGDPDEAEATAHRLIAANVSDTELANMAVTVAPVPGRPSRLRVTISGTVDNFFGAIFGQNQSVVTRTSVADYSGPVPMGSPCNVFGQEPTGAGDVRYDNGDCANNKLWLNIAGPQSPKINGDRFQANDCGGGPYSCSGSNSEYSPDGYFYLIKARQAGTINVQAFDPEFAAVGDHCESSTLNGAAGIPLALAPVPDPASRYSSSSASPFCTGDVLFNDNPVTTSFVFRGPYDGSNPLGAPILSSCPAKQFVGTKANLADLLKTSNASPAAREVQASFRRWVSLCTFTAPSPGEYLVQVLTNVRPGDNAADSGTHGYGLGGGHNRMSLRVHYTTGQSNASLALSGLLRMSVYANANAVDSTFYLARVGSGAAGQVLKIELYDIGDAAAPGSLQVLPPVDATAGAALSVFSGCTRQVNETGPRTAMSSCIENVSVGEFNGQVLTILVPIPATYRCTDADPSGCWVRIRYNFSGGIQDTTTWSASLEGDPVRLVE